MTRTILAALLLAPLAGPALADVPGRDWIGVPRVKAVLAHRGYRVTKVEADDGHWEGEATRRGRRYEFHVDAHSGAITKLERDRD